LYIIAPNRDEVSSPNGGYLLAGNFKSNTFSLSNPDQVDTAEILHLDATDLDTEDAFANPNSGAVC
jgi:hypothetical protein